MQPVKDPSEPALIGAVNEAMRAYSESSRLCASAYNPAVVQDAIRGLKVGKAPRPNGIPNRALKHLPLKCRVIQRDFSNPVHPANWKNARVFSILKPGKDPALTSTYLPISLLETIGKLFEKVLLTRIPF